MLEKLIWMSAFMLIGARHPGATVGVFEKEYQSGVSSLIPELASVAAAERGFSFDEGIEQRLCAYSRAVAHFPTDVKEEEIQIHAHSTQHGSRRLRSYKRI